MKKLEKLSNAKFEAISNVKQASIIGGGNDDPIYGPLTLPEVTCTPWGNDALSAASIQTAGEQYPVDDANGNPL